MSAFNQIVLEIINKKARPCSPFRGPPLVDHTAKKARKPCALLYLIIQPDLPAYKRAASGQTFPFRETTDRAQAEEENSHKQNQQSHAEAADHRGQLADGFAGVAAFADAVVICLVHDIVSICLTI